MLSVGIDVGTTTTQVVFSRLEMRDTSRPGGIPRIQVTDREIVYQSAIRFTPLLGPDEIDAEQLVRMVQEEYRNAAVTPDRIETGAVIITGEIARAKNAEIMLEKLSAFAGDFVVTVAGPNVEAQIAARGSGAAAYSGRHYTQVTNIDIGGGTANAAVFRAGTHIGSSGLAVGGRQIQIEPTSGLVRAIAPPGRKIVEALGLGLREGAPAEFDALQRFCSCMADLTVDLALGRVSELGKALQLTPPLQEAEQSRVLFFSGGVAAYYYRPVPVSSLSEVVLHEDLGPLYAQQLRLHSGLRGFRIEEPTETLRATVLGAAGQTVTLSGSTIWADAAILPLRNFAVIDPQIAHDRLTEPGYLGARFLDAVRRWDVTREHTGFALVLDLPSDLNYHTLLTVVEALVEFATPEVLSGHPLVLILEHDYAQVIGQTLTGRRPDLQVISIDQVGLGEGDFIDIGVPILGGRVVPLSIKTLIFYE